VQDHGDGSSVSRKLRQAFIAKTYGCGLDFDWQTSGAAATIEPNQDRPAWQAGTTRKSPENRPREAPIFPQPKVNVARWLRCAAVCVLFAGVTALGAHAQTGSDFPNKPVRILVPYGPGGAGDLTARMVADKLSQYLKQPFIVENRPGAGGIAAARAVLDAAADGYTLGIFGNGQAISASLFQELPYDVIKDFAQISVLANFEMLLAVPPTSPFKSVKDVIEAARKAPGKLNLGAINPGSTQNLSAHLFEQVSGAKFTVVTYRTTPDLVTALLRGDVDLGFDYFAGLGTTIGPDKIHIIATSGEERDPLLRDIPTARESGLPDYVMTSWNGLESRAGTPAEVIRTLNAGVRRAVAEPDLQERSLRLGLEARSGSPAEMRERMSADIAKWRVVIEKAGIPKQ
jgi:tripartite-type tricarboxylate transporter receptor subunit TctC